MTTTATQLTIHGYTVRWDRDQWIVSRPRSQDHKLSKGSGKQKDLAYHSKLEHALGWIINRALGEAGIESVDEVYQFMSMQPEVICRTIKQCSGVTELLQAQLIK